MAGALTRMSGRSTAAAGPTSSPFRYWRLVFGPDNAANPGGTSVIAVAEVEFRTSVGGADVTGSGTASDDGHTVGGFTAAGAFANDGDTSQWASSGNAPFYLAYDFGSGNDKAIVEVAIMPRTGFTGGQAPGQFKVQASSNNTDWIDQWWIARPSAHSFTNNTLTVFTKPIVEQSPAANRTRYFRLSLTGSNGGSFVRAGSILLKTVPNSTDDAHFGTPTASTTLAGSAGAAFDSMDGSEQGTDWIATNSGFPQWIQYDFGNNPVNISEIRYLTGGGVDTSQAPNGIDFQTSSNGTVWTTVKSVVPGTWATATAKTFTIP